MLNSGLRCYRDAYILVSGTITNTGAGDEDIVRKADERKKRSNIKNCASFSDCISEINNTQIDNAKYIDVMIPMYNVIEYSFIQKT